MFENSQHDLDTLPRAEEVALNDLDRRYRTEVLTQSLIVWGVIMLISAIPVVIVAKPEGLRKVLIFIPAAQALLAVLITWLVVAQARVKKMALREHDIIFRSGLWFRRLVLLPLNRVQHIELSSGPLQRRFDLASLKFYTAGGAAVDLKIDGLSTEHARRLRDHIMERTER
ncbi:MAG: PH domain-containing protein [Pseudomonadota bacterium]